jgi:hypothetical protein
MTDKKDDIEVVVSEEETDLALPLDVDILKDDKDAPVKAEAAGKPAPEDDPVESLRRQLAEAQAEADRERRARADAERQARDNAERAASATNGTIAAHLDAVESALSQTKLRAENAQKAYAAAMEVADYDAAAKAQREMSGAEIDLRTLDSGKRELLQRQKQAKEAPPQTRQERSGVDGYIDGIMENSSAKAQDYIRRNRSALKSEKDVNRMIAAHNFAVNSDIEPDTEAYFAAIDKQMGWNQQQEERPAPKPQTKTVAAPVSRDGAPGVTNPNRITLSPAQVAIAKELGISPAAYAKNLMKLKANGRDPNADGLRLSADIRN